MICFLILRYDEAYEFEDEDDQKDEKVDEKN